MENNRIFLRAGAGKVKWHRCARCGLYFISRSLALEAILKGCPGCVGIRPALPAGRLGGLAARYQAEPRDRW